MDRQMLRMWLRAGFIEECRMYPTRQGTPQGGIISPLLMNMTLDGLQHCVKNSVPWYVPGTRRKAGVNVIRYADDFVVTAKERKLLTDNVLPAIESFLEERGLSLSAEKSRIVHIDEGFDFLGQHLRKYKGKLIIKPSKEAIKGVVAKTRDIIKEHRGKAIHHMIEKLTHTLRGWANYHRYVCSGQTFSHVDRCIHKNLWNWAHHRHRNKGKLRLRKKYFRTSGRSNWTFYGNYTLPRGKKGVMELYKVSGTLLAHRVKVRENANPFLPEWQVYFAKRKLRKYSTLPARNRPRTLEAGVAG